MFAIRRLRTWNPLLGFWGWSPYPLNTRSDSSTSTHLIIFKIPLAILAAIAAFQMRGSWKWVHARLEVTATSPFGDNIDWSMHLGWLTMMIMWPWALISGVAVFSTDIKGPNLWFLAMGIIDLGLSLAFSVSLGLQDEWLPTRPKGCVGAATFQIPNTVPPTPNFFTLASIGHGRYRKDPKAVCDKLVGNWQTGVAVAFFSMLVAYLGIFFDTRPRSVLHPHRPLIGLVLVFFGPMVLALRFLRSFVVPRVLFWSRVVAKAARCWRSQGPPRAAASQWKSFWISPWKNTETTGAKPVSRYALGDSKTYEIQNPGLHSILCIEHILLGIASELCYDDMLNLSKACRHVHEAVFPSQDMKWRTWKLQKHCCTVADRGCAVADETDDEVEDANSLDTRIHSLLSTIDPGAVHALPLAIPSTSAAAGAVAAAAHPANVAGFLTAPLQPPQQPHPQSNKEKEIKPLTNFNAPLKHPCPYCHDPICPTCSKAPSLPPIPESFHARRCAPLCAKCYYSYFCIAKRWPPPGVPQGTQRHPLRRKGVCGKEGPCAGRPSHDTSDTWRVGSRKWRTSRKERANGGGEATMPEPVCRSCDWRRRELGEDIQGKAREEVRREMREDAVLGPRAKKRGAGAGAGGEEYWKSPREEEEEGVDVEARLGAKCGKCKGVLGTGVFGVRFWVCRVCGGECRDECHVPWARKRRVGDLESGLGSGGTDV